MQLKQQVLMPVASMRPRVVQSMTFRKLISPASSPRHVVTN